MPSLAVMDKSPYMQREHVLDRGHQKNKAGMLDVHYSKERNGILCPEHHGWGAWQMMIRMFKAR